MSRQAPDSTDETGSARGFDRPDGYSGQEYTIGRDIAEGQRHAAPASHAQKDTRDLPRDAGQRASSDPVSGEVRGSGAGIGGGNPGEDFDSAAPSGDSYPLTGGEGIDHRPGDLGPPRLPK